MQARTLMDEGSIEVIAEVRRRLAALSRSGHYRSCILEFELSEGEVADLESNGILVLRRRGDLCYPFEVHFAPAEYRMLLSDPWFDFVRRGIKRYEGRRALPSVAAVRVGDFVKFEHFIRVDCVGDFAASSELPFRARVVGKHRFPTFEAALVELGLPEVLPGVETVQAGVDVYLRFVSEATQRRDGVFMLELRL